MDTVRFVALVCRRFRPEESRIVVRQGVAWLELSNEKSWVGLSKGQPGNDGDWSGVSQDSKGDGSSIGVFRNGLSIDATRTELA